MHIPPLTALSVLTMTVALAACGGGGDSATAPPAPAPPTAPSPPTSDPKATAAASTAQNNAACKSLGDFYWEIGNTTAVLASGKIGTAFDRTTTMQVASASKWVYGAYVVEKRGAAGVDPVADVPYLNFTSGYTNMDLGCPGSGGTVDQCLASGGAGDLSPANVGKFYYDSGHMEKHASNFSLGGATGTTLGTEVSSVLTGTGSAVKLTYIDALLAAGVETDAANYANFLRKMLVGSASTLRIASLLGTNAVCTKAGTCGTAVKSPTTEDWQYSLGHWVENDADTKAKDNQAFSSAGAFGFYPWVSSDRTLYGILARKVVGSGEQQGFLSSQCGRLVRRAYVTGTAQ